MNLFKKIIITLATIFISCEALADNNLLLTYDKTEKEKDLPRNFRDLSSLGINAIASGQFSEKHLQEIRKKYPNQKIIIVDLRRESHGFINGEAVSWRAPFDSSNLNKDVDGVIGDEKSRFSIFKKNQKIIINKILEKDHENGWYSSVDPEFVAINSFATEQDLAWKNGFVYKRFAVQDHGKPSDKDLVAYVEFIKHLPKNTKIYVHCAAGRGRTTTFLTVYDILKNGKTMSFDQIIKRQHKIGGSNLAKIDNDDKPYKNRAEDRLQMLKDFYNERRCGR